MRLDPRTDVLHSLSAPHGPERIWQYADAIVKVIENVGELAS